MQSRRPWFRVTHRNASDDRVTCGQGQWEGLPPPVTVGTALPRWATLLPFRPIRSRPVVAEWLVHPNRYGLRRVVRA